MRDPQWCMGSSIEEVRKVPFGGDYGSASVGKER